MWFAFTDTGLRCQELCQLNISDLSGNELVIRSGKGGKRRSVSLGEAATHMLHEYLISYRPSGEDYLFLTDEGQGMKPRHVAKRLELWAKKASVKNVAPHRFRATFATQFVLKEGNDLIKLQALLGHSTLDMSRRYVKMAMEEEAQLTNSVRSVVDQLFSVEQVKPAEHTVTSSWISPNASAKQHGICRIYSEFSGYGSVVKHVSNVCRDDECFHSIPTRCCTKYVTVQMGKKPS